MNIVVVVSGGLTETLQAGPLLAALSAAGGDGLVLACPSIAADVAHDIVAAHEVLPIAGLSAAPGPLALARLWTALRRRRVDVAVLCTESAAVRATVYAAAVPRRVGCAGGLSDRLLTDAVPCAEDNRSLAWLALAHTLGVPTGAAVSRFSPGPAAIAVAEQLLLSNGVGDGRLLVAIAPGHGFDDGSVAAWSPERFAHLANRLAGRHGAGVILVGDSRDRPAAQAMRIDLSADTIDFCGELNLATTAAVIARCDLLIATDTPLLHLAAAVGTASVGLFGPTDGHRRAPAGSEHRVVQALGNGTAPVTLDGIRVDDVLAGIESAL